MSQPEEFKQWVTTQSGLDSLSMTTAPIPEPGENEVLVKIHTVSLNYRDTEGMSFSSCLRSEQDLASLSEWLNVCAIPARAGCGGIQSTSGLIPQIITTLETLLHTISNFV
jgi:hypothetical protein